MGYVPQNNLTDHIMAQLSANLKAKRMSKFDSLYEPNY